MDFKKRINKAFDDVDKILQDGISLPSKIRVPLRHALENLAIACTSYDDYERGYLSNSRESIKSSVDKEILEAAVYDGLMEASPHTQDVAVEWFSNEIDMDDFDSVDDLANYIRNRVEDFADANPGIEQDLIDCGLI